jgi:F-type H+-transporting ATPase subunit gamma
MASLRDIKRRITSVKSTQKITRAMKMVAAAKLRRAQDAITRARPYAHRMRELVNNLALRTELDHHPLLAHRTEGTVVVIVVTSDRGLCGAFNSNVANAAQQYIAERLEGRTVEVAVVGRKGNEFLRRRNLAIRDAYTHLDDSSLLAESQRIIDGVAASFMQAEVSEVYCVYNEFKSAISQKVVMEKLLPFEPTRGREEAKHTVDYVYEPSVPAVFEALLIQHLHTQMHRVLMESAASEHGARMTAMESATSNAGDMIERLTLHYNRVRQNAITTELIEVVSGAEAL